MFESMYLRIWKLTQRKERGKIAWTLSLYKPNVKSFGVKKINFKTLIANTLLSPTYWDFNGEYLLLSHFFRWIKFITWFYEINSKIFSRLWQKKVIINYTFKHPFCWLPVSIYTNIHIIYINSQFIDLIRGYFGLTRDPSALGLNLSENNSHWI